MATLYFFERNAEDFHLTLSITVPPRNPDILIYHFKVELPAKYSDEPDNWRRRINLYNSATRHEIYKEIIAIGAVIGIQSHPGFRETLSWLTTLPTR